MGLIDDSGTFFFIGIRGTGLSAEERDFLDEIRPGGVILFSRNVESPGQLQALCAELRALPGTPAIGIDQEWGPVNRMGDLFPALPPAGRLATADEVREVAALTGRLLASLGLQLDFAPVVDLSEPDMANGIGIRSFGTHPERTTTMAGAFLAGLATAGVLGTLKHFPGLGGTVVDSHQVLPRVDLDRDALWDRDLLPYRRLVADHPTVPVMVGHGWYPALEPAGEAGGPAPASLSPSIVNGLLRGELGHRGVVITDDLEMGAVTGEGDDVFDDAVAIRALLAGVDWTLICHRKERILAAKAELDRELRGSAALRRLAEASLERIHTLTAAQNRWHENAGPTARAQSLDRLAGEFESFLNRHSG